MKVRAISYKSGNRVVGSIGYIRGDVNCWVHNCHVCLKEKRYRYLNTPAMTRHLSGHHYRRVEPVFQSIGG